MNDLDYKDIARNYRLENVNLKEQNKALLKQVVELKKQLEDVSKNK